MKTETVNILMLHLSVAVPLRIGELDRLDRPLRTRKCAQWARNAVDQITGHGDILQFHGGRPSEVAAAFNHLARGLAALAFTPGGVYFANWHWCAAGHRLGLGGVVHADAVRLGCGIPRKARRRSEGQLGDAVGELRRRLDRLHAD